MNAAHPVEHQQSKPTVRSNTIWTDGDRFLVANAEVGWDGRGGVNQYLHRCFPHWSLDSIKSAQYKELVQELRERTPASSSPITEPPVVVLPPVTTTNTNLVNVPLIVTPPHINVPIVVELPPITTTITVPEVTDPDTFDIAVTAGSTATDYIDTTDATYADPHDISHPTIADPSGISDPDSGTADYLRIDPDSSIDLVITNFSPTAPVFIPAPGLTLHTGVNIDLDTAKDINNDSIYININNINFNIDTDINIDLNKDLDIDCTPHDDDDLEIHLDDHPHLHTTNGTSNIFTHEHPNSTADAHAQTEPNRRLDNNADFHLPSIPSP